MKKLLVIGILITGFAFSSFAQQSPSEKKESRREIQKNIKEELNLTAAQSEEVRKIHKEFREKSGVIRNNQQLTREQKRHQLKTLQKDKTDKMNQVLTIEQQQKMAQMRKEGKHRKQQLKAESAL